MTLPPLSPNAWLRWDLVSRLLPTEGHSVLEVGCGQGGFGARLAQRYRYVGLEPDVTSFEVARTRLAAASVDGEVRNGDLSVLGPTETFDLVCAFEVLEHIEHDAKALTEWAGRLRPGGWLILSTPALQHRFGPFDAMVGHYRRYNPADMARLLRETGLTNVDVRQFGGALGYALEAVRNQIGKRRMVAAEASMAEKTSGSGRLLQPSSRIRGAATEYGTLPFRWVERRMPGRGPGLVARAQNPI